MAGLSFASLRAGRKYYLINYGDRYEFELETVLSNEDFRVKDLHTLERYTISDLLKFGKGKDFEIRELRE
ncbi:MAG: hypothetical protein ACK5RG_19435 [Cyclobacteriaceae bacterium]|jgi:hypothetical protein|nr:hypothetical protein [Flammeovirgaceae bacterium]